MFTTTSADRSRKMESQEGPAFAALPDHVKENPTAPGHLELLLNAMVQDGDATISQIDETGPRYMITEQGLSKYPWLK